MSCWYSVSKIWKQFPQTAEAAGAEHLQTHRLTRNDCCRNIFSTISTFSSRWGEKLGQNTLKHLQCNFNVDIEYCNTERHYSILNWLLSAASWFISWRTRLHASFHLIFCLRVSMCLSKIKIVLVHVLLNSSWCSGPETMQCSLWKHMQRRKWTKNPSIAHWKTHNTMEMWGIIGHTFESLWDCKISLLVCFNISVTWCIPLLA